MVIKADSCKDFRVFAMVRIGNKSTHRFQLERILTVLITSQIKLRTLHVFSRLTRAVTIKSLPVCI